MRLVSYSTSAGSSVGVRVRERVVDISALRPDLPADMAELLAAGPAVLRELAECLAGADTSRAPSLAELRLLPVIPKPGKVLCLGLNYIDHAREASLPIPKHPVVFLRATTSLVAANESIAAPLLSDQLDYEGELAVVIGKSGCDISVESALSHVAGYSVFNDITVRDYQLRGPQWTIGKNFDRTGAFGPELVTADELPPGADGLRIQTRVNGQTVQDGNSADMIFKVAETIASLSETMTLEAGDVIVTGTPAGVGAARKPPLWLKPGDLCEVEIEGVGRLTTPVMAARGSGKRAATK